MLTKRRPGRPSADDPGTPSSLGQRIRQARQALGVGLAAVAGADFSRAFLNQVELGRAHPSTQTLRIIARRLQQPIDYFLEEPGDSSAALELILTEAEMSLYHSDSARAERLVSRMLHRPLPLELRTRAQLILATAYLRQGKPEVAKPVIGRRSMSPNGRRGRICSSTSTTGLAASITSFGMPTRMAHGSRERSSLISLRAW